MILPLRDYQFQAIKQISKHYQQGTRRQLLILPTGSGKTVIFAHLSRRVNKRTLIIAHREELLTQASNKINMIWPEASIGLVQGSHDNHQDKQVVVASIQTLSKPHRLNTIKKDFGLCVIDECHHATSRSYRTVLEALGCFDKNGPLTVGFTATPNRTDRVGLGEVFEAVSYTRTILEMVEEGYLVDLRAIRINTSVDLTDVKVIAGDYDETELAKKINVQHRNQIIAEAFLEHCPERKAIAFAVNIAHSDALAETFRKNGIKSESITSKTPPAKRVQILKDFEKGEIQILCNSNILTEGYDCPTVNALLLCRPTKSEACLVQQVGRGLRTYPGKNDCLILDITDNLLQHNMLSVPRIFGMTDEAAERMAKDKTSILEEKNQEKLQYQGKGKVTYTIEELDVFAGSIFSWVSNGKSYFLTLPDDEMIALHPDSADPTLYYTVLYKGIKTRHLTKRPLTIEYATGYAEEFVRRNRIEVIKVLRRDTRWANEPASPGQIKTLQNAKKVPPKDLTKGKASRMISLIIANRKEYLANKEAQKTENQVAATTTQPEKQPVPQKETASASAPKPKEQAQTPSPKTGLTDNRRNFLMDLLRDRRITLNTEISKLTNETAHELINAILKKQPHSLIQNPDNK